MIDIQIDDFAVKDMLDSVEARAYDMYQAMEEIGRMMVLSVRNNFLQEGRPERWAERKDPYSWWPLLRKSGRLYGSIFYEADRDSLTVDHDTPYGDYLDQGTEYMPARPFLIMQDEDVQRAEEKLYRHLGFDL